MAENQVNPAVLRRTQELLGKYVKKPVLSDKLLRKPPFRFLHDVVNAVINDTGFLESVFTNDELVYENVKEKDAKINYLQKLIDAVNLSQPDGGVSLKVRPSRIVAGHDCERTNELLQAIGLAIAAQSKPKKSTATSKNAPVVDSPAVVATGEPKPKTKRPTASKSPRIEKATAETKSEKKPSKSSSDVKPTKTSTTQLTKPAKSSKVPAKEPPKLVKSRSKDEKDSAKDPERKKSKVEKPLAESAKPFNQIESAVESVPESHQLPSRPLSHIDENSAPTEPLVKDSNVEQNDVIDRKSDRRPSEHSENQAEQMVVASEKSPAVPDKSPEQVRREAKKEAAVTNQAIVEPEPLKEAVITNEKGADETAIKTRGRSGKSSSQKRSDEAEVTPSVPQNEFKENFPIASEEPPPLATIEPIPPPVSRPRTALRPPSVRPASARPGAPRRRVRNVEVFLPADDMIVQPKGGAAAQAPIDAFGLDLGDDGDQLIVIEDEATMAIGGKDDVNTMMKAADGGGDGATKIADDLAQGHLVQQILQTQKELVQQGGDAEKDAEKDLAASHQRKSSGHEMDKLRDSIQQLTRSVHPLGKLLDFLQEDMDAMQAELQMWRSSSASAKAELGRERSENATALAPLQQQLTQIEATIREQHALAQTSRLNILQNEEKMLQLFGEL